MILSNEFADNYDDCKPRASGDDPSQLVLGDALAP